MRLTLTKHHGLGNDFLVVRDCGTNIEWSLVARQLCERRRGIGADGLLVASTEPAGRHRMVLYNPDGSQNLISQARTWQVSSRPSRSC